MDPASVIVAALCGGAGAAPDDGASGTEPDGYEELRTLVAQRLARGGTGVPWLAGEHLREEQGRTRLECAVRLREIHEDWTAVILAQQVLGQLDPAGTAEGRYAVARYWRWAFADAWVFASLAGSGPATGYPLAQVIAHGDALNHAILTEHEFNRAVPRLLAAGLIGADAEAGRYWHTEAGQALYGEQILGRDWIDAAPAALRTLGEPQDGDWSVTADAVDRAYVEYAPQYRRHVNRRRIRAGLPKI